MIGIAFEEDEPPLLRGGLIGLAFNRRKQSLVIVSTADEDEVHVAEEPLAQLRAFARRVRATCPASTGKITVVGTEV